MSKKKTIINNNYLLRKMKFRSRNGRKEGCVRIHKANTRLHELTKADITIWLLKNGYTVYTEVEWLDESGRADIVAIQNGQGYIVEVLCSEKEEKYVEKTMKYTEEFTMVKVRAKDFKYEEFCL